MRLVSTAAWEKMHRKAAFLIPNTANEFAKIGDAVADLRRAQRKELGENSRLRFVLVSTSQPAFERGLFGRTKINKQGRLNSPRRQLCKHKSCCFFSINIPSSPIMAHLILTGATGLVGSAALAHVLSVSLPAGKISKLSILSRRPVPMAEGKPNVEVIIQNDFTKYEPELLEKLKGAEGCIWAQGISVTQVDKE